MANGDDIFGHYPSASWQVGGGSVLTFPVLAITETGGNRIVPQERTYRQGAKLDMTGAKARTWQFTALFNNSLIEGTDDGVPLYPQRLRQIIRSFDVQETGELTLPTVGKVRAKAQDYTRREANEARDEATLELTFVEDNEDALDRAQLNPPSVVATLRRLAEQTVMSAQRNGTWNDDLASLTEIAAEIEGALLAPGRAVDDLGARVRAHRRALERIEAAALAASDESLFGDPRGSETVRQIRIMLDREAAAEEERTRSRPRTKAFVIDVELTSIFEIAARFNQDVDELLDINASRIDDPFMLDRGMVIRIFESSPR